MCVVARVADSYSSRMLILVIVLVALWVILAVIGFAIKGLIWLAIIGIILAIATILIGFVRRAALRARAPKS